MARTVHRTFRAWLLSQRERNDPIGDLARDVACDPDFPRKVQTLDHLTAYLEGEGACLGALEAARKAWATFAEVQRRLADDAVIQALA